MVILPENEFYKRKDHYCIEEIIKFISYLLNADNHKNLGKLSILIILHIINSFQSIPIGALEMQVSTNEHMTYY